MSTLCFSSYFFASCHSVHIPYIVSLLHPYCTYHFIISRPSRGTVDVCTPLVRNIPERLQKTSKCFVGNCVKLCKINQIWAGGSALLPQPLRCVCTAGNLCCFVFVDLEVANVLMRSWRGKKVLWKRTATSKPLLSL